MIDKKGTILLVLKILEKYSDENHLLTHQQIIDLMQSDYGISVERKSIGNSIDILIELGYDITKAKKMGCYYSGRLFDASEIRFLDDAVFSSKSISGKYAKNIIKRLNEHLSIYQQKGYDYLVNSNAITRSDNIQLFLNIETINEAIKKGKKITFYYYTYNEKGELVPRKGNNRYDVSPYYLINSQGRYYLLCNSHTNNKKPISTYRVDLIKDVFIAEDSLIPLKSFVGMEDFNIAQYINEHIYPFGGDVVNASIEIVKPAAMQYIIDWFGDRAFVNKTTNENYVVSIRCDEDALFYWLLQYGECVKLLSPQKLKDRLKNHYEEQVKRYK